MDAPVRTRPVSAGAMAGRRPPIRRGNLLPYLVELAAVAIGYIVIAKLSLTLASVNPSATPIWPTTGFALAAVLLRGYRIFPALFVGALIVNATTAGSIGTSLGIAVGNMLESLVGAAVINRWSGGRNTFDTPVGVAKFALVCFVPSTMISATLGVVSLSLAGYVSWSDFRSVWTTWWVGDLAGALVITPVIVLWAARTEAVLDRKALVQTASVYAAAIAVGLIAFSPLLDQTPGRTSLAFLAILPLMWAAVRSDQRDTATTALLLTGFAVWGTLANGGPFVRGSLNESFLLLLAFMISVSVPSLALAAETAVRKEHEKHVDFVMHELSHRSKNLLSVVQSMANQVARGTDNFESFFHGFSTRLQAFAGTHDLLILGNWRGVDIRDLVRTQLEPFHNPAEGAIAAEGPSLRLSPKAAEQIGLALHELGTNAAKHGSLSVAAGAVSIWWELEADDDQRACLRFTWKESGGPLVAQPQAHGFGTLIITKLVPHSLQGTASLEFEPDGLKFELLLPSARVLA